MKSFTKQKLVFVWDAFISYCLVAENVHINQVLSEMSEWNPEMTGNVF